MSDQIFNKIRDSLLAMDPVAWSEKYLTLDGKPFRLTASGYKPLVDIFRYIGVKALDRDGKPVVWVKARQVAGTTTASALEMYFMGSGLFGTANNPPMRIIHNWPTLDRAAAYSKTKLASMIESSILVNLTNGKKGQKPYMKSLIDTSSQANDNMGFKQFIGGNHLWIESVGLEGSRLRGKTADVMFFDECFPYDQYVETTDGKEKIGKLYDNFLLGKTTPLIKSFNENTELFEYKKITNAWNKGERQLLKIICGNKIIKCTPNHRFLTENGWKEANNLTVGTLLKTSNGTNLCIRAVNDDQMQIILGSFLGDGHLSTYKNNRYRLNIIHDIKQTEYCQWKAEQFNCKTIKIQKNGYSNKEAIKFCTKTFGLQEELPLTKTTCPQWILDNLDARGIAIWFMDDGNRNTWNTGSSGCISTNSFDEDSHIRFVEKFRSLGIECHYKLYKASNNKKYFSLFFNKKGFSELCNIIRPYIHKNLSYKVSNYINSDYIWNNDYKSYNFTVVDSIELCNTLENVYDIEIADNHNFVIAPSRRSKNSGGPIVHNCQEMPPAALSNSTKVLTKAQYGMLGEGVQVFFGTPLQRGSEFWHLWQQSSQQFYHLGCEQCKKTFPLYTPGSNDWESIWIYGNIVKCTHCNYEQDRLQAIDRGKWIPLKDPAEAKFVGFHLNQLYLPEFTKEQIMDKKPGNSAINTERSYQNEILGEFFQGEAGIITPEEIRIKCGDPERKFRGAVAPGEEVITFLGIDIGAKADLEQLVNSDKIRGQGQSYSTAVVLSLTGPGKLSIEHAFKFKRNDLASKKSVLDEEMKRYKCKLAVCDIGYAHDFNEIMQTEYGDKFLASQAAGRVTEKVKYNADIFPKVITFERDFWIMELYEQMKQGLIRFPLGSYEQIAWLIQHCANMEIKPSLSRTGEVTPHYIKAGVNDGFMALLNAYIAYKFFLSQGFQVRNSLLQNDIGKKKQASVMAVYSSR